MADTPDTNDQDSPETESESQEVTHYSPKQGRIGRGLYILGYVTHGIRRHKRRSISLLIGILIGVALVSSVFVWTDTGTRVAIDDYFAGMPFHYYAVQSFNFPENDPNAIYPVRNWVNQHPTTRQSHVVYSSIALLEVRDLRPDVQIYPWPYMRGIKDCQAFFVNNDFLERVERAFDVSGTFRLSGNQVIVSRRVIEDAETVLGIEITIGSTIEVAIAQNMYGANTIGATWPIYLPPLRVVGIYEDRPTLDPLHQAFPTQSRQNWGPFSGQEVVLGWIDGILLPDTLTAITPAVRDLIATRVMFPRLLVEVDPTYFFAVGLDQTVPVLDYLFSRLEQTFDIHLGGRQSLNDLQLYIESYYERQTMGILVLPIIILSILLSIFTSALFMAGRKPEIALLRSRGASYRQLYATLLVEFFILALIALVIGGFLGILIGALIPSATAFLQFDVNIFMRFLNMTEINVVPWIIGGLVCILPPAIYTIIISRSFLNEELALSIRGNHSRWSVSGWIQAIYILIVIGIFWPLVSLILATPFNIDLAFTLFIVSIIFWVILCDACARLLRPGIAGFSRIFRPIFGQKSHLFATSVKVRRSRIVPLLIILILTFSVTIYAAVEAHSYQTHLYRQIDYYVGGDVRIYSGPVPAQRISELINLPQIKTATPFIETRANIGQIEFRLLGIDPTAYAQVGNWDESSMVGDSYQNVLSRLAANPSAVIMPHHIATQLNKHTGDTIDIDVWDQRIVLLETKTFDVVGEVYTAPGFGYANPSDPAASISPISGFGFQKSEAFAFVHQDYFLIEVPSWKVYDYINLTQTFLCNVEPRYSINQALDAVVSVDYVYATWSPYTFDLEEVYPDGYLYTQGIISLLSIGFLAALVISIVALTVFVNTIVAERKTEYAIMRALGGTKSQITAIVLGEFMGLILAAFLFSLILGGVFSWLLMFTILGLFPQPYIIPFNIIYPFSLLVTILGLVLLGLLAGAYIPARRAGQVQVSTLLRNL